MNDYKITVVVPTYNTGNDLYNLFDSIMNQSMGFENVEVIFVDDASTDENTIAILEKLNEFDNVSAIFLKDNSGFPGKGRNIGLKKAQGEYVIFSDHDDSYNPDAFKKMYEKISSKNGDLLFTNYIKVYPDRKEKEKTPFNGENIEIANVDEDLRLLSLGPSIWTKLFRKDFLMENNISFLEGMLGEDLELFIHTILLSNKTIYLDDFYSYNYSIRDSDEDKSTIHLRTKLIFSKMIEGYFETYNLLVSLDKMDYFDLIFKNHFVYFLTSLIKSDLSDEDKKALLISINPLIKKELVFSPNLNEKIYSKLTGYLREDNFDKATKELKKIRRERRIKEKIKRIF